MSEMINSHGRGKGRERWRGGEGSGGRRNDRGWQVRLQKVSGVNLLVVLSVVLWPSEPTTCWNDITYNHRVSWPHVQSLHTSNIIIMITASIWVDTVYVLLVTVLLGIRWAEWWVSKLLYCCKTVGKMPIDKLAQNVELSFQDFHFEILLSHSTSITY